MCEMSSIGLKRVEELKSEELCARVQMLWAAPEEVEVIRYHFCLISAGCNFNQRLKRKLKRPLLSPFHTDFRWNIVVFSPIFDDTSCIFT